MAASNGGDILLRKAIEFCLTLDGLKIPRVRHFPELLQRKSFYRAGAPWKL
ncbi:hypothetical protein [Microcoleus sp. herbarium12]|uniref:hypothetical protein n=1 Tax=Microcoleus sp. herbarium12 TaxID=3055437 RepID=UPI002FD4CB7E